MCCCFEDSPWPLRKQSHWKEKWFLVEKIISSFSQRIVFLSNYKRSLRYSNVTFSSMANKKKITLSASRNCWHEITWYTFKNYLHSIERKQLDENSSELDRSFFHSCFFYFITMYWYFTEIIEHLTRNFTIYIMCIYARATVFIRYVRFLKMFQWRKISLTNNDIRYRIVTIVKFRFEVATRFE